MANCAANPWIGPVRKHHRAPICSSVKASKRECGTALPATPDNAAATGRFPRSGRGTDRRGCRFRLAGLGLQDMELTMTERRKTARPRKTAARKGARKVAGKVTARKAAQPRRSSSPKQASPKRWSQRVTRESDALDLKQGVLRLRDPKRIADSLQRSAETSSRRKAG